MKLGRLLLVCGVLHNRCAESCRFLLYYAVVFMKSGFSYALMMTSAFVLGACSLAESYNAGSTEDLLAAQGEWVLVEERRAPSPVEKHMDTRGKVKPSDISKSKNYTKSAKSMHVDEDIHFRVLRLERQMDVVRDDLAQIKPMILDQPMTKKAQAKPMVKMPGQKRHVMPKKSVVKHDKAQMGGPLRVVGVRTGVHPGKYRFVMDVSAAPKFSYDLDNGEQLLTIDLPSTGWDTAMEKRLGGSSVVKGYRALVDGDVTHLIIELQAPAKVLMAKAFKPNHVHGHRVVFDIAPF